MGECYVWNWWNIEEIITKLQKAKSEAERWVSVMFETDETLKK